MDIIDAKSAEISMTGPTILRRRSLSVPAANGKISAINKKNINPVKTSVLRLIESLRSLLMMSLNNMKHSI